MSIVEKAAEKLKTLQPETAASPHAEAMSPHAAPAIERLQERTRPAEPALESAPLWHVDYRSLERMGMIPSGNEAHERLAHELRRIKRPLLNNAIGKGAKALPNANRIMITSAVPSEGKTFTAVNLALSLAREPDFEVLLVDGDIPKSDVTRALGLGGQPGLMEALAERCKPSDVIVRTDVPNLSVVPVGQRHPLATELFGSLRMQYVLEELGGRTSRRLVVFDSSPLLATSDSQVLAAHVGQVVMVIAAGNTRRSAVDSALQCFNDSQYVGLVLNMSRQSAGEGYYGSYYGQYPAPREGET